MAKKSKTATKRSEAMKAYWAEKKSKWPKGKPFKKSKKLKGTKIGKPILMVQEGEGWKALDAEADKKMLIPLLPKNYRLKIDGFAYDTDIDIEIRGVPDNLGTADKTRLLLLIGLACKLQVA